MTTPRLALSLILTLTAAAKAQTYTQSGSGTFTNPLVWNFGVGAVPASSSGLTLNFLSYGTATVAVNNDLNLTLNRLNLNSFGSGALSLNGSQGAGYAFTGAAQVHLLGSGGTSGLSARVVLASTATGLTLDGAGASGLAINSFISSNTAVGAPLTIAMDARNAGTGIVQLTAANSFAGGVVLSSGTLSLLDARALGDRNNTLTVQGGNLQLGVTVANNLTLSSTLNVNSTSSGTLSGVLSGAGFGINMRPGATTATLSLTGPNTYTGATVVGGPTFATAPLDGAGRLSISGAVGSILTTSGISIRDGAVLNLRYAGGASASNSRVAIGTAITTQSGFLQVVGNAGVVKQSVGTVNAGGLTTLAALTNDAGTGTAGAATELTVANLVRSTGATVVFEGQNLGLNAVTTGLGAAQGNVILTQINGATSATALVGGGGAANSLTMSILPWALGASANGGNLYNGGTGFVTVGANGVRLLDTGTEYNTANNLNTAGTTDNVRLTATPTALSAAKTVNSLYFGTTGLTQSGAFNLTLTSGALASNVASATISSPVLFGSGGTGEAVISVVGVLTAGTNNLTLSGGFSAASLTKSGHGDLTISTANPVISGGITINGGEIRVDAISRLGLSGANGITVNGHSQAAERAGLHFLHSGTQTLAATTPITVNAGTASITLNRNDATLAVNSVISGSGGVSYHLLSTGGVITIGGVNTYTGPTFISGAGGSFVDISGDSAFGSSADPNASFLNLSGTTTLRLNGAWTSARAINISGTSTLDTQANNATLSGPITGAFGLTKTGTGTLTIGGTGAVGLDSSYSGTLTLSTGSLAITGNGALNAASITLQNSTALTFSGAADIDTTDGSSTPWRSINALTGIAANSIVLGSSSLAPVDLRVSSSAASVETPISGFGKLVKTGTGTLTLTGMNTFTGGVEIWGGALTFGADNQLGHSSNVIALKGGIFQNAFAFTTSRAFTLGATPQPIISGSTVQTLVNGINAGADLTLSGVVSGAGGFNKSGTGVLALANTGNNFTGDIQISQGSVTYTDSLQLGAASGRVRLNGGTLTYLGTTAQTVARSLIVTASSTVSAGSGAGGSLNLSGSILGASTLSKGGLNTLTLSGASPYFFGALSIGNGSTATGNVNLTGTMPRASVTLNASSGATLDMSGLTRELGSLGTTAFNSFATGTTVALGTGGKLTTGFSNIAMTWNGNITGTGTASVTKVGTSTLTLNTSASTFPGGFHVLSGNVHLTAVGVLPAQSALTLGAWGGATNAGPVFTIDNTGTNLGSRLADTQAIHSNAGEFVFTTNTGTASSETAGSLRGAGMSTVTMTTGGTLNFGDATFGLNRVDRGTFLLRAGNANMGSAAATTAIANLTFGNSGSLGLIGSGGLAGTQNISILPYAVGGITAGDSGSNFVTYGPNGVRVLNTTTEVVPPSDQASVIGAVTASNYRFANLNLTTTQITGGSDLTVNSLGIAGTASRTRLESASTEKLIITSGLLLNTVANVWATDTVAPFARVLGVHTAELRSGATNTQELNVFTTGGDLLLGAKIGTSGGLTKSGAANLYLSNITNTYSGITTINAGRLVIDNKAALGSSTSLVIGGGFLQYRGTDTTLTGFTVKAAGGAAAGLGASAGFDIVSGTTLTLPSAAVSGNGGILKSGMGVLKLQGSNTNTGATIIAGGALAIDGAAALGTNNRLIFATGSSNQGGQTLRFDANNITLTQDIITNTADSLIGFGFDTNGNNATLSGPVISTTILRGLYKLGAGNLTLSAANAYTGPTQIFGGSLTLGGANGSILPSTGGNGFVAGSILLFPGTSLVLDNTGTNNNNRLPDVWDAPFGQGDSSIVGGIFLGNGELKIRGNASVPTNERVSRFDFLAGTVTLESNGQNVSLTSGRLFRTNSASVGLIRGTNLGATTGTRTNWFLTDLGSGGTTLVGGGGAEGTPFVSIIPGIMGDTSATGVGTDLTTYASDTGIRLLTSGEYSSTIPASNFDSARAPNVLIAGTTLTVDTTTHLTALKLTAGAVLTGSGAPTLLSSTVLATGNATISTPVLRAQGNAGYSFLTPGAATTLTVSSVLNGGGFFKYGAGTLELTSSSYGQGAIGIHQGTLKLTGASAALNPLNSALTIAAGATFDLGGQDPVISGLSATGSLSGAGQIVQGGTIALGGNRLTLYDSTLSLWSGTLTGTGGLTKGLFSSGFTTFTQPQPYTGGTRIYRGTLALAARATLASTQIDVLGGTLTFDNSDDNAFAGGYLADRAPVGGTINLAGSLTFTENANALANHSLGTVNLIGGAFLTITHNGATPSTTTIANLNRAAGRGTLTLSATNLGLAQSATGNARIFASLIDGAAPASALVGAGGAVGSTTQSILPWGSSSTFSNFLTYGADGFRPLQTSEYAATLGAGATDNVRITASATLTAATTANALLVTSGSVSGAFDLTLTSGAFAAASSNTHGVNTNALLTGAGNTRELVIKTSHTAGTNTTLNYNLTTAGGVTKFGPGTLVLGGAANTFTGGLHIHEGMVNYTADSQLGAAANVITFGGNASSLLSRGLQYSGTDKVINQDRAIVTTSYGMLSAPAQTLFRINGSISGPGTLGFSQSISQGAVYEFNGTNTYTGDTYIERGHLSISSDANLGAGGALIFHQSAFNEGVVLRGDWTTSKTLHLDFAANINTAGFNATLNGPVIGTSSFSKSGLGSLTLTVPNPLESPLTINAGSVILRDRGALSNGGTVNHGAALILDDTGTHYPDRIPDASTISISGGELALRGSSSVLTEEVINNLTINSSSANAVTLTPGAGQAAILRLGGTLTANGSTVFRGTNLGLSTPGTAGSSTIIMTETNSVQQSGLANIAFLTGGAAPAGSPSISIIKGGFGDTSATGLGTQLVTYDLDKGIRLLDPNTEYTTTLVDGSIVTDNIKVASGTLTINAATTTANALWFNGNATLAGTGVTTLTSGTLLVTGTGNLLNGGLTTSGGNTLAIGGPGDLTVNGILSGGGITKTGAGALTLNNANIFTGTVLLGSGVVNVGHAGAFNTNPIRAYDAELRNTSANPITLNSPVQIDGTLRVGGTQALTLSGTVALNNAHRTIAVTNTALTTISGVISGTAGLPGIGLTKTGPGTLVLTGANTYGDQATTVGFYLSQTIVQQGELRISNTTGSGTGGSGILVNAGATLSGSGAIAAGVNSITINGTLSIGDNNSAAADLALGTNTIGTGFNLGTTSKLNFGLFTGAGNGDNTLDLTASDLLILTTNAININIATQLILENPNNMSTWAIGDKWQLWQIGGSPVISGNLPYYNIIAPWFVYGDRSFDFNVSTGVLSIVSGVPEPSRALLLLLGLSAALFRRRRS